MPGAADFTADDAVAIACREFNIWREALRIARVENGSSRRSL